VTTLETELREHLVALMPLEHAPAHLRLAFHDAGTFDARTRTGGAHGRSPQIRGDSQTRTSSNSWRKAAVPC